MLDIETGQISWKTPIISDIKANLPDNQWICTMKNKLNIKREYWPEVTSTPHFIVEIMYEGCNIIYDDIYFDNLDQIVPDLEVLEKTRKGSVNLDGGNRFIATLEATTTGGITINFQTESFPPLFPGELKLKGYFSIDGEYTSKVLGDLGKLFKDGKNSYISIYSS